MKDWEDPNIVPDSVLGDLMPKSGMKMLQEQGPTIRQHLAHVESLHRVILQQREQILAAFIAETGCLPSECEQVMMYTPTGFKCWVRKREG